MKADEIKLEEIINFNEGRLDLGGRRVVIHDMNAFAQFRKDLIEITGLNNAKQILIRFGYYWGQADASAMNRIYKWDDIYEWIKAGTRLHTLQGVVKVLINALKIDKENGKFYMEAAWENSGEAEEHISALGYSDKPVCWMLTGYASGYSSYCMNTNIYFTETKCIGKKDNICYAVGKDMKSWGDKINDVISYFKFEDIKSKIDALAAEIKQKNLKIQEQRKKLFYYEQNEKSFIEEIHSKKFQKVINIAKRAAKFDTSILITGETGVGKEVVAKFIHEISLRKKFPFIPINCSALPENLIESELFGHKAGSFTGAIKNEQGLFESAENGTVFLDEIGDISLNMQLKILRVIQEKEIFRIGENKPRKINVRIIAATNKVLEKSINEGKFREDLYFRLKVISLNIPPLRERKEDIITLARSFVKHFSIKFKIKNLILHASCIKYLENYYWPGNVRELENIIERAIVLSENNIIYPESLPDELLSFKNNKDIICGTENLDEIEKKYILKNLNDNGWNKTKTAESLGISQATLWRKIKKFDLK